MLLILGAFAIVPLALPWLIRRIGPRAFTVAALLPLAAFAHAAILTPSVLTGRIPYEEFSWIFGPRLSKGNPRGP